jgi:hypothetical protein
MKYWKLFVVKDVLWTRLCYMFTVRVISVDSLGEVVVEDAAGPKRQAETPPPTYEEALYRFTHTLLFYLQTSPAFHTSIQFIFRIPQPSL